MGLRSDGVIAFEEFSMTGTSSGKMMKTYWFRRLATTYGHKKCIIHLVSLS